MLISEIYESRQGEGLLTGKTSIFVRTSGCNLRCGFCDTPFTSWKPSGDSCSIEKIISTIGQFEAEHVVITGGEPMLPREIAMLTAAIKSLNKHITIETAGTLFREVDCDLISISPKLSNSTPDPGRAGEWRSQHENARYRPMIINRLMERHDYQLKYVVAKQEDIVEIQEHLNGLSSWDPKRVMLMPEGIDHEQLAEKQKWLEPVCEELGLQFCPRKHIEWYGNRRGT